MAKQKTVAYVLEFEVAYGNVSIGDKTARISASVDRKKLTLAKADQNLCDRRLSGKLLGKRRGDAPDQQTFSGMEDDLILEGVFDAKGYSVSSDKLKIGFTFNLKEIEVSEFAQFAKRTGVVTIYDVGDIPEEEKKEAKKDSEHDEDKED